MGIDLAKLKELPNRLRGDADVAAGCGYEYEYLDQAADGIDSLIAEVERLRGALLEVREAFANADAECFAATIGAIDAALEGGGI